MMLLSCMLDQTLKQDQFEYGQENTILQIKEIPIEFYLSEALHVYGKVDQTHVSLFLVFHIGFYMSTYLHIR